MSGRGQIDNGPAMERVVRSPRMTSQIERARHSLDTATLELYLVSILVADERGRFSQAAIRAMEDLLDHGRVGYDRLDDGAIRVWYHGGRP